MTHRTIEQVASTWVNNGGDPAKVVIAVAVADAESGLDDTAVSPSEDYGLWQINAIHMGTLGITYENWWDDNVNARVAIALSGNGTNWAAWCTCWTDPGPNCGHDYLPIPQNPSPAFSNLDFVASILHIEGTPAPAPQSVTNIQSVGSAWSELNEFIGPYLRAKHGHQAITHNMLGALPL